MLPRTDLTSQTGTGQISGQLLVPQEHLSGSFGPKSIPKCRGPPWVAAKPQPWGPLKVRKWPLLLSNSDLPVSGPGYSGSTRPAKLALGPAFWDLGACRKPHGAAGRGLAAGLCSGVGQICALVRFGDMKYGPNFRLPVVPPKAPGGVVWT